MARGVPGNRAGCDGGQGPASLLLRAYPASMSDEPTYSRGDRINAAFCLLIAAALAAVAADVLFDLTGRARGRRLAREAGAHMAAQAASGD